jgi:hypothetical protein
MLRRGKRLHAKPGVQRDGDRLRPGADRQNAQPGPKDHGFGKKPHNGLPRPGRDGVEPPREPLGAKVQPAACPRLSSAWTG